MKLYNKVKFNVSWKAKKAHYEALYSTLHITPAQLRELADAMEQHGAVSVKMTVTKDYERELQLVPGDEANYTVEPLTLPAAEPSA